jgi:hypothetical protein
MHCVAIAVSALLCRRCTDRPGQFDLQFEWTLGLLAVALNDGFPDVCYRGSRSTGDVDVVIAAGSTAVAPAQ